MTPKLIEKKKKIENIVIEHGLVLNTLHHVTYIPIITFRNKALHGSFHVCKNGPIRTSTRQCIKFHQNNSKITACCLNTSKQYGQTGKTNLESKSYSESIGQTNDGFISNPSACCMHLYKPYRICVRGMNC